ncbi:MAG: DUF4394 domain-containing protein [Armatimonadaceae bacterium]
MRNLFATKMNGVLSAAGLLGLLTLSAPAQAQTAFAIGNGGTSLITFQVNNPGAASSVADFNIGGTQAFLDAIDFRPATGQLYGYSDETDTFYLVNTSTGALTAVQTATGDATTSTFFLGLDYNPTIDRARVVTLAGENRVLNPTNTTPPVNVTSLFYGPGDPNEGTPPAIIENAYTNNFGGATTTVQYGLDANLDTLVTIANNAGTLTTVGALGVDINNNSLLAGFDIITPGGVAGNNFAYAIIDSSDFGGNPIFYSIDLGTGAATQIGGVGGNFGNVYSLALTAAPEPASGGLLLMALAGGGLLYHRKRRKTA